MRESSRAPIQDNCQCKTRKNEHDPRSETGTQDPVRQATASNRVVAVDSRPRHTPAVFNAMFA